MTSASSKSASAASSTTPLGTSAKARHRRRPTRRKQRIGRYVEDAVPGTKNEEVRGLASKAVELAHRVKHSETPTRRDARYRR